MPYLTLKKAFSKDLDALKRNARKVYQRANEILMELQRDQEPSAPHRSETQVPNCLKFELPDGYRMVLQTIEGSTGLIALSVGTHDHVDSFLDGHKGYIFDPKTGTLKELRLATADETTVEVVPSRTLGCKKWGQVLQSNISRRVAGVWFIWCPWSISFVWFDEPERQARPAHQIDCL